MQNITMIYLFIFSCGQDPILTRLETEPESVPDTIEEEERLLPPKPAQPKKLPPENNSVPQPPLGENSRDTLEGDRVEGLPSSDPLPGVPSSEPKPGMPQEPAPGNPFQDGPLVKLSGEIIVPNWKGEPIRIDIFDGDQRQIGGSRPNVVMMEHLISDGAFEINIPQNDSYYWIGAYVDVDGDGKPGPNDPSAWYSGNPISGKEATEGVILQLTVPDDSRPE
jgi:hypothetical protein